MYVQLYNRLINMTCYHMYYASTATIHNTSQPVRPCSSRANRRDRSLAKSFQLCLAGIFVMFEMLLSKLRFGATIAAICAGVRNDGASDEAELKSPP
jgi:hypothetical protein